MLTEPLTTMEHAAAARIAAAAGTVLTGTTFADVDAITVDHPALLKARDCLCTAVALRVAGSAASSIAFRSEGTIVPSGTINRMFHDQGTRVNGTNVDVVAHYLEAVDIYVDLHEGTVIRHAFTAWKGRRDHWYKAEHGPHQGQWTANYDPRYLYGHLIEADRPGDSAKTFAGLVNEALSVYLPGVDAAAVTDNATFNVTFVVRYKKDTAKIGDLVEQTARNVVIEGLGFQAEPFAA